MEPVRGSGRMHHGGGGMRFPTEEDGDGQIKKGSFSGVLELELTDQARIIFLFAAEAATAQEVARCWLGSRRRPTISKSMRGRSWSERGSISSWPMMPARLTRRRIASLSSAGEGKIERTAGTTED